MAGKNPLLYYMLKNAYTWVKITYIQQSIANQLDSFKKSSKAI